MDRTWLDDINWSPEGLVAVVVQDHATSVVLMFAYMNKAAALLTVSSGYAHYWSRSRQRLWKKGEESGNLQLVKRIRLDCDGDVLLISVEQIGGVACHTGRSSCFFRTLEGEQWSISLPVVRDPETMYSRVRGDAHD